MTSARIALSLVAGALLALLGTAPATAADASWRLEQPAPPPPPPGVAPAPFPVPLGAVGDIALVAPNRGVLTTAGNGPVPMGLYAYDGVAWHPFSTVCGARDGRVAWAGPGELWAVADQRSGQQQGTTALPLNDRSLCRIANGRVLGSYATPQGRADSYQEMDAAACAAADDCWFGGTLLRSPPPYGAFHLHWDGSSVTAVPSEVAPVSNDPAHPVADMEAFLGTVVESVPIGAEDPQNPAGPDVPGAPSWLHLLSPDLTNPFTPLTVAVALGRTPRGFAVTPTDLDAFRLSSADGTMWAVAGSLGSQRAGVVALLADAGGNITQLSLTADGGELPPFGSRVVDVAAEPGTGAAWVAYVPPADDDRARVLRVEADGRVTRSDAVPSDGDPGGSKGSASRIACAGPWDCWLVTRRGWLFHLTDGTPHQRDADPAFAGVITTRPSDDGVPFQPPIDPPLDDSLINQPRATVEEDPGQTTGPGGRRATGRRVPKPLVRLLGTSVPRGTTTLVVRFSLSRRARISILAKRHGKVVARTRPRTLAKGTRQLRLRLRRDRWPTGLAIKARAIR